MEAWSRFLEWTNTENTGLRWAILLRDGDDDSHFVSLAEWETDSQRDAWRNHVDFAKQVGRCRALCDEFRGFDYARAASVGHPMFQPQSTT